MPLSVTRSGTYAGVPVSATRSYVYDGFERLCKRIEPEAGGTLFQYDAQGCASAASAGCTRAADGVGNLIGSAEGQSASLSCDAIPAGARIGRSYDARDRLLSVTYPNAPATLYSYAADGALTTLTQGDSAWSYGYNTRRLLTSETLSFGDTYSFNYGYNALGHLASMSTPSGLNLGYAPNALGQPTQAGAFASGATYFPDGSLKQFTYGNGLIHSVTQNARHLPSQVRDASGSTVVHDFGYSYDANGNVTAINDVGQSGLQTRSLLYDARDRLVSATATQLWGNASYAYDPLDNLRLADQGSRQYRYQYDSNNRLTQLTDPAGAALPGLDFAYDAQGRQIRKGTQVRTFDGANRITAIDGETYAYDGTGRRIATWAADGRTKVEVYTQDGKLAFAVDSAKGGGSSFVYLAGQRIAEDHWQCSTDTHTVTYFHTDALGSPVATTDASGNVLERTYYAPYGEALNRTVDGPGYTGHVMDAATGLVYAQQRYYDPVVGRFLSIDPVQADPDSGSNFNRFWYANNNPYRYTDPDGRAPPGCGDGTCEKPKPAAPDRRSITFKSPGSKAFLATSARAVASDAARSPGVARGVLGRSPLLLPLLLTGDTPGNRSPERNNSTEDEPSEGKIIFRVWGGLSRIDGASWTPVNPLFLRASGGDFRDVAGLPNVNDGSMLTIGRLLNPSGVKSVAPADPLDGNRGGLIEFKIPNPLGSNSVQVIDTISVQPAF